MCQLLYIFIENEIKKQLDPCDGCFLQTNVQMNENNKITVKLWYSASSNNHVVSASLLVYFTHS